MKERHAYVEVGLRLQFKKDKTVSRNEESKEDEKFFDHYEDALVAQQYKQECD